MRTPALLLQVSIVHCPVTITSTAQLTQSKRKHIRQRPARIKRHVKLRRHHDNPPPRRAPPEAAPKRPRERRQARGVEGAEHQAHGELRVAEAQQARDGRLREAGEEDRADEAARHGAREGEVVVRGREARGGAGPAGDAVDEDVVGGLEGEGFFNLGVRR
jgi:hypothetical protein